MLGANTDPYQPVEKRLRVTRDILEVLLEARHPVAVITKGALVLRDLDLLRELAAHNLAHVTVSVTTLDPRAQAHARAAHGLAAGSTRVVAELARRRSAGRRACGADDPGGQ